MIKKMMDKKLSFKQFDSRNYYKQCLFYMQDFVLTVYFKRIQTNAARNFVILYM